MFLYFLFILRGSARSEERAGVNAPTRATLSRRAESCCVCLSLDVGLSRVFFICVFIFF